MVHDPLRTSEYAYPRKPAPDTASQVCMVILIVIIAWTLMCIVHLIVNPNSKYGPYRTPILSSMLSKFRSARLSSNTTGADDAFVPDVSPCTNITPCPKGDASCAEWKTASESMKEKNDAILRGFVKENKTSLVLFYAPWCPHCSAAMPGFVNASKKINMPSAIVNAELIPKKSIGGDSSSVVEITHFPFVCLFTPGAEKPVVLQDVSEEGIVKATSDGALNEKAESEASLSAFFR